MSTRRLFMKAAAATAAIPFIAPLLRGRARAAAPAEPLAIQAVVFDPHFAESRAFGETAGALGHNVHALAGDGDVTRLWTDHLQGRWADRPTAIAGLTGQGAMFCLEQLAWGYGMRVVFQADHRRGPSGTVEHALFATSDVTTAHSRLAAAGADYGAEAARIVAALPYGGGQIVWRSGASMDDEAVEPLVTWVIAPVGAANMKRA